MSQFNFYLELGLETLKKNRNYKEKVLQKLCSFELVSTMTKASFNEHQDWAFQNYLEALLML